jgi:hypothetical protein
MSLFILTFIISILMLLIDILTPYPVPFFYLSPNPTQLRSSINFWSFPNLSSHSVLKFILLSISNTSSYILSSPRVCVSFQSFQNREGNRNYRDAFFSHTFVQFFSVWRIIYDSSFIYLLYICQLVYIGTGLACFVFVYMCLCVCVCICMCAHLFPEDQN